MDLNYLFFRQQIEKSAADKAVDRGARRSHDGLARVYEEAIARATGTKFYPQGR